MWFQPTAEGRRTHLSMLSHPVLNSQHVTWGHAFTPYQASLPLSLVLYMIAGRRGHLGS